MPVSRRHACAILAATPLALGLSGKAHAATHSVTIKGFAFSPASLTVAKGETVVFTNEDGAPHTATATDGSFDTGRLNRGQSAEVTITKSGKTDYVCAFHNGMKGSVTAS